MADFDRHEESVLDPRRRTLSMILVGLMALLMVRLFVLQVVRYEYYTKLSFSNQLQRERIIAPRGIIRARDGSKLVVNMPVYQISILPNRASKRRELLRLACGWLKLDPVKVQADLDAWMNRYPDGREMVLVQAADKEQISVLRENRDLLSFFKLAMEQRRYFPEGSLAAHVFGYVGEVTDAELAKFDEFEQGDILGRTGLELAYEKYLRGADGIRIVGISVAGTEVEEVSRLMSEDEIERLGGARAPIPGDDVFLTIDLNVQRAAEAAFQWERGALVAMDPRNGEILAAVSRPAYDPNMFIEGVSDETWKQLFEDPAKPMYNRIVQGAYPPGSVFKLVTAYAALTNGKISKHAYQKPCYGGLQFGNRYFKCWQDKGHGALQIDMAIIQSCDVFFYQLGEKLSVGEFAQAGRLFGLGKKTGIDLPSEVPGNLPDQAYLDRRFGKRGWSRGLLLNYSIGQGEILTTPVQLCALVARFANGGKMVRPHVVRKIIDPDGKTVFTAGETAAPIAGVDQDALQYIREAMRQVVENDHGTGRAAALNGISVAGKTGTAQNPLGQDHAIFVAYAPAEDHAICIAIVMENAGHGGSMAAPVAKQVMAAFFNPLEGAGPMVIRSPGAGR
ncbi:MAG: penicillin-binding protein 2 [Candidatus Krumholzibacteria bacterium]|nr:penicillin-binding protein 2 [Candidatus Krumholzibacteria bacterium]